MNPRRVGYAIALILWIAVLIAVTVGLQLPYPIAIIIGLIGWLMVAALFRTPGRRVRQRNKIPPNYEVVAQKANAIEAEMKRVGLWQDQPLKPEQYNFHAAFAGDTMAFPQWLQFIFLPRVRDIIARKGQFPPASNVGAYAVREFDTYREDTVMLTHLLNEFDHLF